MSDYQFHPIAAIFPLLEGDQLSALAADIREHGLREPAWLYEGKILDGRNRSTGCTMAGVTLKTKDFYGTEEEAIAFSWSMNGPRRHMTESQLSMAGAKMRPALAAAAKKRQAESARRNQPQAKGQKVESLPPSEKGKTRDQAGAIVGVSGKLIDAGTRVLKSGSPEVIKAVEDGKLPVTVAAKLSRLPHDTQTTAVAGGRAAIKKALVPKNAPRDYPVSDRMTKWLESLAVIPTAIKQDYGSPSEMMKLSGWDRKRTSYFSDLLSRVVKALDQLHKEVSKNVN